MCCKYPVSYENKVAGTAEVTKCGMYYQIHCLCPLKSKNKFRMIVSCMGRETDLGLCLPYDDGVYLKTALPMKQLGEGDLVFHIRTDERADDWIPICENAPFAYLSQLPYAIYCPVDGKPGLLIRGKG